MTKIGHGPSGPRETGHGPSIHHNDAEADINPDCAVGKHRACSGTAWCEACDEMVPCECECGHE